MDNIKDYNLGNFFGISKDDIKLSNVDIVCQIFFILGKLKKYIYI